MVLFKITYHISVYLYTYLISLSVYIYVCMYICAYIYICINFLYCLCRTGPVEMKKWGRLFKTYYELQDGINKGLIHTQGFFECRDTSCMPMNLARTLCFCVIFFLSILPFSSCCLTIDPRRKWEDSKLNLNGIRISKCFTLNNCVLNILIILSGY